MKTIFLTSNIGASVKVNGMKAPHPINNSNGIIEQIKASVKKLGNFVFVASNPAYEGNDSYAKVAFDGFKLSGINFKNLIVVDNRNKQDIEEIIKNADLVFLSGGHVLTQNKALIDMNMKSILESYDGVIMGQSAGSMNLAKTVYNYPESLEEIDEPRFIAGLGLTDFTIIPHFDVEKGNEQVDPRIDLMNDYLKKDSKDLPLYCVKNYSHIKIENGNAEFFGDIYIMEDGKLRQIDSCKTKA